MQTVSAFLKQQLYPLQSPACITWMHFQRCVWFPAGFRSSLRATSKRASRFRRFPPRVLAAKTGGGQGGGAEKQRQLDRRALLKSLPRPSLSMLLTSHKWTTLPFYFLPSLISLSFSLPPPPSLNQFMPLYSSVAPFQSRWLFAGR